MKRYSIMVTEFGSDRELNFVSSTAIRNQSSRGLKPKP
jgi:hypothetical protein